MNTLGRRIAMARAGASLTMEQLGSALGKAKASVSYWEKGRNEPSLDDLIQIAVVTGVSREWLAFGDGVVYPITDIAPPSA